MARRGEQFERSVFEFYKGLDADAQILFDHKVIDRDTGHLRQVDVWVVHKIFGQFLVQVLISCKDHTRRLDVGEVESLSAEMRSTGATIGVLYGRNGFTTAALSKARSQQISCCRLFDNAPPDHPSELVLDAFVAQPVYQLVVEATTPEAPEDVLWRDVLPTPERVTDSAISVAELIVQACLQLLVRCEDERNGVAGGVGPLDLQSHVDFAGRQASPPFRLHLAITWQWYRGALDAYRLKGSFNATSAEFLGHATVGPIAMHSAPHRSIWEECSPPPLAHNRLRVVCSALATPTLEGLFQVLGSLPLFAGGVRTFRTPPAASLDSLIPPLLGPTNASPLAINVTTRFGKGA